MMALISPGGLVAAATPISTAAAISAGITVACDIDAAVASRSRRLAFLFFRSAVSHKGQSQNDKACQHDWQSAKGGGFGVHSGSLSRYSMHLKVIDNA